MPELMERLHAAFAQSLTIVGAVADFLAAHQRALNLAVVLCILCLALLIVRNNAALRQARARGARLAPVLEPRTGGAVAKRKEPTSQPVAEPPANQPLRQKEHAPELGDKLSRLESGQLELNREIVRLYDALKAARSDVDAISRHLAAAPHPASVEPPGIVGGAAGSRSEQPATVPAPADGAPTGRELAVGGLVGPLADGLAETKDRVHRLEAVAASHHRMLLSVREAVDQTPDWREIKAAVAESLEGLSTINGPADRPHPPP